MATPCASTATLAPTWGCNASVDACSQKRTARERRGDEPIEHIDVGRDLDR
jgi:hypothetical protein